MTTPSPPTPDASFEREFPTGTACSSETIAGSEPESGRGSTIGPGPSSLASTPVIAAEVDWMALSDRSKAILRHIAVPISEGRSQQEIASDLGRSTRWVSRALEDLRDEIRSQRNG